MLGIGIGNNLRGALKKIINIIAGFFWQDKNNIWPLQNTNWDNT
jgi:hypothetical protein